MQGMLEVYKGELLQQFYIWQVDMETLVWGEWEGRGVYNANEKRVYLRRQPGWGN